MNKDKSYLQMLRELSAKCKSISIVQDNDGDFSVVIPKKIHLVCGFHADTIEHAIEKAWTALCSQ